MKTTGFDRDATGARRLARLPMALAVAGLLGATALTVPYFSSQLTGGTAVAAEQQAYTFNPTLGFADLVEQVQPAVVSIRVASGGLNLSSNRSGEGGQRRGGEQYRGEEEGGQPGAGARKGGSAEGQDGRQGEGQRRGDGGRQGEGNRGDRGDDGREFGFQVPRPFAQSQGSGFFVSADGYIVTNHHVIEDAGQVEVILADGSAYPAEVIGHDNKTDLALLRVTADRQFDYVSFADAEARVGDWVVAVGNPFGLGGSVTTGIVSGRGRDIGSGPYDDYLQIDAPINRGNSGGPAFNLNGDVVGVNTAIYSPSGGNVGIGFAIPARIAAHVIEELRDDGVVTRGWLGVHIQSVTAEIAETLGLDEATGALVTQVADGSPAQVGNLEVGDLIVSVDGDDISDPKDLARKIAQIDPGASAALELYRDGELTTVELVIGQMPGPDRQASLQQPEPEETTSLASLGLTLSMADGEGVLVTDVERNSMAAMTGLQQGDVIIEIAGERVSSPRDVEQRVSALRENGKSAILLLVRSGEQQRFVALKFGS